MAGGNNGGGGKKKLNNQKSNPFNSGGATWGFGAPAPAKDDNKAEKSTPAKDEFKAENEKSTAADSTVDKDAGDGLNKAFGDLKLKDASEELDEENPWASVAKVGRKKKKKGAKSGVEDKPSVVAKPGTNDNSAEGSKFSDKLSKMSNNPEPSSKNGKTQTAAVSNAMDTPATPIMGEEETQTTTVVSEEDAQNTSTPTAKGTQDTPTTSDQDTQTDPVESTTSKPTSKPVYRETSVETNPITSAKPKALTTNAGIQINPVEFSKPKPVYCSAGTQTNLPPTTTVPPPIPKVNPTPYTKPTISTSDPIINLTSDNISFVSAHKGLLTRNSDYFKEFFLPGLMHAKKYRYSPASTRTTISLKDCLPHGPADMFELEVYTEWLYSGVLGDHLSMSDDIFEDLVDLYVFGEQIHDKVFCNTVMDLITCIHKMQGYLWLGDVVKQVYEKTDKGSMLKEFVADMYAWNVEMDGSGLREFAGDIPREFLVDLVVKIVECREKDSEVYWGRWLVEEGYYVY